MEYMRGLLRDNDLFRAYVTVRARERADGQGCRTPRPPWLQVRGRRWWAWPALSPTPTVPPATVGGEASAVPAAEAE